MQNAIAAAVTVNNARVAEDAEAQVTLMDFNPVIPTELTSAHVPGALAIGLPVPVHLSLVYVAAVIAESEQAVALTYC